MVDQRLPPITKAGDVWVLGRHRIVCGDALQGDTYGLLLENEPAQLVIADPPSNSLSRKISAVRVQSSIPGSRRRRARCHRLIRNLSCDRIRSVYETSSDGSLHFIFMDWRHIKELLGATTSLYAEMKSLCIWNKSAAGKGSLYGSKHELVFVLKKGNAAHINNIERDRFCRHRSNVWDYSGQNTESKLSLHPTVVPVARSRTRCGDCSNLNCIILDPFGGAGTSLIAAEKTGRRARLIKIEPQFVDCTCQCDGSNLPVERPFMPRPACSSGRRKFLN